MFNNSIVKYFDFETGGPSFEPIFSKTDKDIFGFVLAELLSFAKGEKVAKKEDATAQRFQKYFSEAKQILEEGIAENLSKKKLTTQEKECGALIACFIVWGKKVYTDLRANTMAMVVASRLDSTGSELPIEIWLNKPYASSQISEVLSFMVKFNAELNDEMVREIIQASKKK